VIYPHVKGLENLDMLPEGTVPPNPTELLYVDRMAKLVEELRERYDYIIFDCAPVEVVADAKVLNNYVDMSLLVIRAGVFERKQLPYIQEFYDTKRYKNMMLLLNATEDLHGVYGRYGYGYGYSYDNTGKRSKRKRQS
jgi:capsular exopolysaccharide synthesis family protein